MVITLTFGFQGLQIQRNFEKKLYFHSHPEMIGILDVPGGVEGGTKRSLGHK